MSSRARKARLERLVARAENAAEMWQVCETSLLRDKLAADRRRQARKYRRALQEIRSLGGDWQSVAKGGEA